MSHTIFATTNEISQLESLFTKKEVKRRQDSKAKSLIPKIHYGVSKNSNLSKVTDKKTINILECISQAKEVGQRLSSLTLQRIIDELTKQKDNGSIYSDHYQTILDDLNASKAQLFPNLQPGKKQYKAGGYEKLEEILGTTFSTQNISRRLMRQIYNTVNLKDFLDFLNS